MKIGCSRCGALPTRFEKIRFAAEVKASIYLFPDEAECSARGKAVSVEEFLEELFERVPARLDFELRDLEELRTESRKTLLVWLDSLGLQR